MATKSTRSRRPGEAKGQQPAGAAGDPEIKASSDPVVHTSYPDLRPVKFTGVKIELDTPSKTAVERMPRHLADHAHGFGTVLRKLEAREFIDGSELADMLAFNKGLPIPPAIQCYLEAFLRGEVKQKRGRKEPTVVDEHILHLSYQDLHLHQKRLRKRKTEQAKKPRTHREEVQAARFGPKGSPYDRTIRIIHRARYPEIETEGAVKTLLSNYGRKHFPKKPRKTRD